MAGDVHIQLSEQDADAERLQLLTSFLREELRDIDGAEPQLQRAGSAPEGTRAVDAVAVGALVVKLLDSRAVRTVLDRIRSWLGRNATAPRSVRLEIDGDTIELASASTEEQQRLLEMFIQRHSPRGDEPWVADEP